MALPQNKFVQLTKHHFPCVFQSCYPPLKALKKLLRCLNALKSPLNGGGGGGNQPSVAGLGLMRTTSVQLARYHGDGRGYVRHRDTPKDAENSDEAERKVTST